MNLLKAFMLTAILSVPLIASADVTVKRILDPVPYLIEGSHSFKLWREVCSDSQITVKVFKKFQNRDTGKVYKSPTPSEYEFKSGSCEAGIYTVHIDTDLPAGNYDYLPRIVYTIDGKTIIQDIPKEIIIIK